MKKFILLGTIILLFSFNSNKIPDDAIRIRVIAASNSSYDQEIKEKVSNKLKNELYLLLKDVKNKEEAEAVINSNMQEIDNTLYSILKKENYNLGYEINFGLNYFPQKEYKGKKYNEGYYESLLITLGNGEGENWWCVLYPTFCLIESNNNVKYDFFLKDLLKKIIK